MGTLSIALEELLITDTSFSANGNNHYFEEIKHLRFYWDIYVQTINGIRGENEGAVLEITLTTDEKIKKVYGMCKLDGIKNAWQAFVPFYSWFGKTHENCQRLATAYQFLSKKTFEQRLSYYVQQLDKYAYFYYDKNNIFSDGRVIDNKSRVLSLRDNPEWGKYYLKLSRPASSPGLFKKNDVVIISTEIDQDVFKVLFAYLTTC